MAEPREDVENLLLSDPLPPQCGAVYDVDPSAVLLGQSPRSRIARVSLLEWSTETLRRDVVRQIAHFVDHIPPLRPFTAGRAFREMAKRDLKLHGYLVHPDFVGRLAKTEAGCHGEPVFVHEDVPPSVTFALCEPEYLGRIPERDGLRGALVFNPRGVIWGSLIQALS